MAFIREKILYSFFIIVLCLPFFVKEASAFAHVSDLITNSAPGEAADHTIIFQLTSAVPPSGRISIVPQSGAFFMGAGFGHEEVDLAVSDARNGEYGERMIGESANAVEDGISVIPNSFNGLVNINLNISTGLEAGKFVRIKLGTNAVYQATGTSQILNPVNPGTYKVSVYSYDASSRLIKQTHPLVAVIAPVTIGNDVPKYMANGSPMGWLGYGTTQTILSVQTNFAGDCRFETASGTPYDNMTGEFSNTGGYLHSVIVSGLTSGVEYEYYIRCKDADEISDDYMKCRYRASTTPFMNESGDPVIVMGCYEYYLGFSVQGQSGDGDGGSSSGDGDDGGGTGGGEGDGTGAGSGGGGSGGGGGGGIGRDMGRDRGSLLPYPPLPENPGVAFTGWSYPGSEVVFLKDGQNVGVMSANSLAEFGAFLPDLVQGVYTFSLWSADSAGRKSSTYSTTFWIDDGTQTVVSDIFLSPTASILKNSYNAGEVINLNGQSVPGAKVTAYIFPKSAKEFKDSSALSAGSGTVDSAGAWFLSAESEGLPEGQYIVRAKAVNSEGKESEYSQNLEISIGAAPVSDGACEGADLNQDGKVNLTDFSILLYHWGPDNECADQNKNGRVEIADFSIMMYYWTG